MYDDESTEKAAATMLEYANDLDLNFNAAALEFCLNRLRQLREMKWGGQ